MKRFIKLFKKNIYLIAGFSYLGGVIVSFLFVTSFIIGMINSSLPGGSEIIVPQVKFHLEEYEKIQNLVGVPLKEPQREVAKLLEETLPPPPLQEPPLQEVVENPLEPVEEPVEEPKLDKSSVSVSVLNGSGVTGAAGKIRSALEAEGFKTGKVGNTDRTQKSRLEIKESKKVYEALIRGVIEKTYTIEEVRILEETNEADAVFIIGLE